MMKTNSLCFRLTLMTGAILLLCSTALTLSASYNAGKQLSAVAVAVPSETGIALAPGQVPVGQDGFPILTPAAGVAGVTKAQRNFDLAGLTALIVISVVGTGAVYFATRRALRPIQELSGQMTAITENNLDVRVDVGRRTDEVGTLCQSFNIMLERLSDSFAAQKQFSANVAHELKTPLATMQASVQVLRLDESPTGDDCLKMLDVVERNTARLRAVIDDLMRLCDEQNQFEQGEVSLPKLFSDIFAELAPQLEETRITPPSRPYFTAFSAKLKKARYSRPSFPVTMGYCPQSISVRIHLAFSCGASSEKISENSLGRDTSPCSNWSCSSQRRIRSSITARSRAVLRSTTSSILSQSSPGGVSSSRST